GDDIIPYHHGKSLFYAASEPKAFLEITGTHNSGFLNSGDTYIKGLRAFLEKYNPPLK
ncbi:MAG: alpha/beta hydrolase, partial [bacterium]|nr:alpha/beta hydrolase [bacterium]